MARKYNISVLASLVTAMLIFSGSVSISSETATDVSAGIQGVPLLPQTSMSASASKVLRHIVDARAAIHAGELKHAERELHTASRLIDYIKSVRPSTQITDHIWVAEKHLDYQKPGDIALDLIPIEISLTDLEEVYLVRQAERHIKNTKSHLAQQDVESARKELIALRESLAQTEVDLPLNSTEEHIGKAFSQLAAGDKTGADITLREAEAGVRFISLGKSTPLARTRRLLWQAIEDYSAGHHLAVKSGLTKALHMLDKIEPPADAKSMHEAQRLRLEINELLQYEEHSDGEVESDLTGFWHRTVALIEREAENIYHAWRDQQSKNHLFRQLIDARFHLFYAEYSLFKTGDIDDARWELERSIEYLQAAVSETSGLQQERIQQILDKVEILNSHVATPDKNDRHQYDEALLELRRLIKKK